jgi:hypothetical protein
VHEFDARSKFRCKQFFGEDDRSNFTSNILWSEGIEGWLDKILQIIRLLEHLHLKKTNQKKEL